MATKKHAKSKTAMKRRLQDLGRESEPMAPAGAAVKTAPAAAPVRMLNSRELAAERCLSRDEVEALLTRLGLRDATHDGATLYDESSVDRLLASEDREKVAAAADLLAGFGNTRFVTEIVQEAFNELREEWLVAADLHGEVSEIKRGIAAKLKKTHRLQQAQRSADIWGELEAMQRFQEALLEAIEAHRQEKGRGDTDVRV